METHDLLCKVIFACISLLGAFIINSVRIALKRGLVQIPGPVAARFTSLWRVGFVWSGSAHEKYRTLHIKYGPIIRTAPNVVDISDPSVIPIIYGINSKFLKSNFYITLGTVFEGEAMDSLFSTRDPVYHKELKRPVAQKYSMTSIRTLEQLVDPCNQIFVESMKEMQGEIIDLGVWLQWYAFDVIGAITFSQRFGFMEKRTDVSNIIHGIENGLHYAGLIGQIPLLHPLLLGNITLLKILKTIVPTFPDPVGIATEMVLQCLQEYDQKAPGDTERRSDFLAFLRQQEKSTGSKMKPRDTMNHLMNNLLAGSDTTAISLRAVFYYIIRDPRVYQALQQEIDEADKAGKLSTFITYAESLELNYMQLCIKEAMRMHPGVSYPLERIVPQGGAQLCGRYIPTGTIVGVNAAVIHRNKEIFGEDADQFRPERWLGGESEATKNMERHLLTFGAGSRTCIGKNISIMEMGKFIPQILRQFDVEWASEEPAWKVHTYWFAKQSGLLVRFKPRQKS